MWKLLDTGKQSAEANMNLDAQLLAKLKSDDSPMIHFYSWARKSATYGYFLRPKEVLSIDQVEKYDLTLARRPTGGGVIFHTCDFAFSVFIPSECKHFSINTLANYQFINHAVKKAVQFFLDKNAPSSSLLKEEPSPMDRACSNFCMAKPTKYDVMIGNRKVAGAAQRRVKNGFLHQGSIAITLPESDLLQAVLIPGTRVYEAMKSSTFSILGSDTTPKQLEEVRKEMKHRLTFYLTKES